MADVKYIVYLADDDEDDLEMLTTALTNISCIATVLCYKKTSALIRQLETLPFSSLPDLIVMDHHIPTYGEGELVRYIRNKKRMDMIALIVYTTVFQESKKSAMLHDGVDSVMTKGNTTKEITEHAGIFCQIIANKKFTATHSRKS